MEKLEDINLLNKNKRKLYTENLYEINHCQYCTENIYFILKMNINEIIKTNYSRNQFYSSFNSDFGNLRKYGINYIIHICLNFLLDDETLYIAIEILDICCKNIKKFGVNSKHNFLILTCTCLFLACKYEEIYPPELEDFLWICNNNIIKEEILKMEILVLKEIDFNFTFFTKLRYLEKLCLLKQNDFNKYECFYLVINEYKNLLRRNNIKRLPFKTIQIFNRNDNFYFHHYEKSEINLENEIFLYLNGICFYLSLFLIDAYVLQENYLNIHSLVLISACLYISRKLLFTKLKLSFEIWDSELENYTTYSKKDFYNLSKEIIKIIQLNQDEQLNILYKKYSTINYLEVCKLKFN